MKSKLEVKTFESNQEREVRGLIVDKLLSTSIPTNQLLSNLQLFINSKNLSRILFFDFLYRQILQVPGVVFDFGTRWGPNAAEFISLRGIYEPYNRHRKVIAFDTFEGFPDINIKDGNSDLMRKGNLELPKGYANELVEILQLLELDNPISHIKKFDVIKGNAVNSLKEYINLNTDTIVALAYFDFDLYEPTYECLNQIKDRLTKGSIVAFDELNDPDSPGETHALMEVFGLPNVRLRRHPHTSRVSYFVVE